MRKLSFMFFAAALASLPAHASLLFQESFDDSALTSRGWYDNTDLRIDSTQHIDGSAASVKYHFAKGATTPDSGGAIRHKFSPTNAVYMRYYVKYSDNWMGSGVSYHPHLFSFLTNQDGDWIGGAQTHLTTYVEDHDGEMRFNIQDSLNIDTNNINTNLVNVTENRAVAGCNGSTDGYPDSCYNSGGWRNEKIWRTGVVSFTNTTGPTYKGNWHKVEAYFKLNSIVNGKAAKDGIVRYWVDGKLIMEHTNIVMRTGKYPNMMFTQMMIAPYIGVGSPIDQTLWVDNLELATAPTSTTDGMNPSAPRLIDVQ